MKKLSLLFVVAAMAFAAPFSAGAANYFQAPEAAQAAEIETVTNQDFVKYFEENRQIKETEDGARVEGSVVVEFRVNQYGVPSGIQVVSGFSRETNREVINLLVAGPRTWAPTDNKRIRTVVEYK